MTKNANESIIPFYNHGDNLFRSVPVAAPLQFPNSYLYDSFEYETIPTINTGQGSPNGDLWRYDSTENSGATRPGSVALVSEPKLYGTQSLRIRRDVGGTSQDMNKVDENTNYTSGFNNHMRKIDIMQWPPGVINRMRFWMKADPGMRQNSRLGSANYHVGTFLRDSASGGSSSESAGNHYYHYYHFEYQGNMWHQVIVDMHPNHRRGNSGSEDLGIISEPYPTIDPGHNYFDAMTLFYLSEKTSGSEPPTDTYVDGFEFYEDPNDEDVENIYSMHGIYNDITGDIVIGFKRLKTLNAPRFVVKYAFSSFHANGGFAAHGQVAPNGSSLAGYSDSVGTGYNGVEYVGNGFPIAGRDAIYIAIKYQGEPTRFREMRIPLTSAGYPSLPTEPALANFPGVP